MDRRIREAIFFVVTYATCAHAAADLLPSDGQAVREPPILEFPDTLPPPTIPKVMITTLRVAKVPIVLEKTELKDVQRRLGGSIRASGDASEAVAWLDLCGTDTNGRWTLRLDSSELGGLRWIDGFTLQRLDANARTVGRCRMIPQGEGGIELPLRFGLA